MESTVVRRTMAQLWRRQVIYIVTVGLLNVHYGNYFRERPEVDSKLLEIACTFWQPPNVKLLLFECLKVKRCINNRLNFWTRLKSNQEDKQHMLVYVVLLNFKVVSQEHHKGKCEWAPLSRTTIFTYFLCVFNVSASL